jgi:hypothetical protein
MNNNGSADKKIEVDLIDLKLKLREELGRRWERSRGTRWEVDAMIRRFYFLPRT